MATVVIDPDLHRRLTELAKLEKKQPQELLHQVLDRYLKDNEPPAPAKPAR